MSKILVAEDDRFLASAYKTKLGKMGFEVKMAGDGVEALEALNNFTPDVIMLDLIMPRMDGFTTLEKIKSDPKWAKVPVIIASNLGQKEDMDRAAKLGAVSYLVKSDLAIEELVNKIKSVL